MAAFMQTDGLRFLVPLLPFLFGRWVFASGLRREGRMSRWPGPSVCSGASRVWRGWCGGLPSRAGGGRLVEAARQGGEATPTPLALVSPRCGEEFYGRADAGVIARTPSRTRLNSGVPRMRSRSVSVSI